MKLIIYSFVLICILNVYNLIDSKCKVAFKKYFSTVINGYKSSSKIPKVNLSTLNSGSSILHFGNQKACLEKAEKVTNITYSYLILHGISINTTLSYDYYKQSETNLLHHFIPDTAIGWCYKSFCNNESEYKSEELKSTKTLISEFFNTDSSEETKKRLNFTDPVQILNELKKYSSSSIIVLIIFFCFLGLVGIICMFITYYFYTVSSNEKESVVFEETQFMDFQENTDTYKEIINKQHRDSLLQTFVEVEKKKDRIIQCLDPLDNLEKITKIYKTQDKLGILDGIKLIALIHIGMSCTYLFLIQYPLKNKQSLLKDVLNLNSKVFFYISADKAFECLFAISGALLALSVYKIQEKNILLLLLTRLIRIFPFMIISCLLPSLLINTSSSKPLIVYLNDYLSVFASKIWKDLLFISNFFPNDDTYIKNKNDKDSFFPINAESNVNLYLLWYLIAEFQIRIIIIVLIKILKLKEKKELKIGIFIGLMLFSIGYSFFIIVYHKISPWDICSITKLEKYRENNINTSLGIPQYWNINNYFKRYVRQFWPHFYPYLLGYIVAEMYLDSLTIKHKNKITFFGKLTKNIKNKFSIGIFNIVFGLFLIVASYIAEYIILKNITQENYTLMFLYSISKIIFIFGLLMIVYTYLVSNHFDSWFNLVNNSYFSIISKLSLSYSIFLPFMIHYFIIKKGDVFFYSGIEIVALSLRVISFTMLLALVVSCFIDLPIKRLINKAIQDKQQ